MFKKAATHLATYRSGEVEKFSRLVKSLGILKKVLRLVKSLGIIKKVSRLKAGVMKNSRLLKNP